MIFTRIFDNRKKIHQTNLFRNGILGAQQFYGRFICRLSILLRISFIFGSHTHMLTHNVTSKWIYCNQSQRFPWVFFFSFHENQSSMKWFSTHFLHYISVFLFIFSFWCYYIIRIGAHIQQTTITFKQNSKFITINHCGFSEIYGNFQLKCKIDLNISDVIDSVGLYAMDLNLRRCDGRE